MWEEHRGPEVIVIVTIHTLHDHINAYTHTHITRRKYEHTHRQQHDGAPVCIEGLEKPHMTQHNDESWKQIYEGITEEHLLKTVR